MEINIIYFNKISFLSNKYLGQKIFKFRSEILFKESNSFSLAIFNPSTL